MSDPQIETAGELPRQAARWDVLTLFENGPAHPALPRTARVRLVESGIPAKPERLDCVDVGAQCGDCACE